MFGNKRKENKQIMIPHGFGPICEENYTWNNAFGVPNKNMYKLMFYNNKTRYVRIFSYIIICLLYFHIFSIAHTFRKQLTNNDHLHCRLVAGRLPGTGFYTGVGRTVPYVG